MGKQAYDIDELIAKSVVNEATEIELQYLKEWENLSGENKEYVAQGFRLMEASGMIEGINTDTAWNTFQEKIQPKSAKVVPFRTNTKSTFRFAVAAAIMLLVSIGALIKNYLSSDKGIETREYLAGNQSERDTLPDGTVVYINKGGHLKYSVNSSSEMREIQLSGEAFFDVKPNNDLGFVVFANDVVIRDIGTSFNVKQSQEGVSVYVKTGILRLSTEQDSGLILSNGESGRYSSAENTFEKDTTGHASNEIAYMTKELDFKDEKLQNVIAAINSAYGTQVSLGNDSLLNSRITVKFESENVDVMLDIIAETLKLQVVHDGDRTILKGIN